MINNIQQQNQMSYGANKNLPNINLGNKLPKDLQLDTKEKVQNATENAKEAVNDTAGMQMLLSMMDGMDPKSPKTWGAIGAFWAAFAGLNDLLNLNLHKNWDKTIFGRFGSLGDKIETAFRNGKGSSLIKPGKAAVNWVKDKLPFLTTPLNPENTFARTQAGGIFFQVSSGMNNILGKYLSKTPDGYKHLFTNAKSAEQAKEWLEQISKDPKLYADKLDDLITNLTRNQDLIGNKCKVALNKYISVGQKYIRNPQNTTWLGKKLATMPTSVMEFATNGTAAGKLFIGMQALIFAQALFKAIKAPKGEKKATFMENVMGDFVYAATAPLMLMPANVIGGLKYAGMGKGTAARQNAVKHYREVLNSLNTLIKEGRVEGDALIRSGIIKSAKDIVIGADGKVQGIDIIAEKGKKVLKNLLYKDAKWYHKPLKKIGEFVSMGLESVKSGNILKGKIGGVMRFVIAMFVVAPIIRKATMVISHKLFGKPTSAIKEEEEAKAKKAEKKAQKAQRKAGRDAMKKIDTNELQARLEAHPEIVNEVQNNEELMAKIQQDPTILINMLDEADKNANTQQTGPKAPFVSPALRAMIEKANPQQGMSTQPQMPAMPQYQVPQNNMQQQTQTPSIQNQKIEPPVKSPAELNPLVNRPVEEPRAYIPSSAPVQKSPLDEAHDLKMNTALSRADEAEKFALNSIGV